MEYTQDMRANYERCPKCGFWHTSKGCPPQFMDFLSRLDRVTAERDRYKVALNEIVRDEVLYIEDAYSMIEVAREALESESE
jgi:hypothetical protein